MPFDFSEKKKWYKRFSTVPAPLRYQVWVPFWLPGNTVFSSKRTYFRISSATRALSAVLYPSYLDFDSTAGTQNTFCGVCDPIHASHGRFSPRDGHEEATRPLGNLSLRVAPRSKFSKSRSELVTNLKKCLLYVFSLRERF